MILILDSIFLYVQAYLDHLSHKPQAIWKENTSTAPYMQIHSLSICAKS